MIEEQKKPRKNYSVLQIIFLIILIVCIGALIKTIMVIKEYGEMLKNPLGYNMEKFGISYCTCYDREWRVIPIEALSYNETFDKFKPKPEYKDTVYDFSNLSAFLNNSNVAK